MRFFETDGNCVIVLIRQPWQKYFRQLLFGNTDYRALSPWLCMLTSPFCNPSIPVNPNKLKNLYNQFTNIVLFDNS